MKSKLSLGTVFAAAALLGGDAFAAEPELVGHWKLDETAGEVVSDSSPAKHHGRAVNHPARAQGRLGGAFVFNGKDNYVELPNSKTLDSLQEGSYSIAVWFRPDAVPPGSDSDNDAEFGIVTKTGWHLGLSYNNQQRFTMTHWLAGNGDPVWTGVGTWQDEYAPGQWYHLVGVVDAAERVVRIYVNGDLINTGDPWEAGAQPRDYDEQTWKIGVASPDASEYAWYAQGVIDDVRFYKGALTDGQIEALYKAGVAGKEQ